MIKLNRASQSVPTPIPTANSAGHARAIAKVEKKLTTHGIDLTRMNKLLVDLDETVTR